jgi:hypothetical protein
VTSVPRTEECSRACGEFIRDWCVANADYPTEMDVSSSPPIIAQEHPPIAFTCPHGSYWYVFPTSEQIAQWARDGVA